MDTISFIRSIGDYMDCYLNMLSPCSGHRVDDIVFVLIGAVVWRSASSIEVLDDTSIVQGNKWLSFCIKDRRFVLIYNRITKHFDLIRDTREGTLIFSFDNSCSSAIVQRVFNAL